MASDHTRSTYLKQLIWFIAIALLVILLDQLSKLAILHTLQPGVSVSVLPGIINFILVFNTGAAFSIGEGAGLIYSIFALLVALVAGWMVVRGKLQGGIIIALGAIVGGGLGNALDRVVSGAVTDFIATAFIDFPIFNVADIFVTCGVAAMLLLLLLQKDPVCE